MPPCKVRYLLGRNKSLGGKVWGFCGSYLNFTVMSDRIKVQVNLKCIPIRHNIMTTFLILCWSSFCCQNSLDPSRHGLHYTPEGPVSCEVGPPWVGLICSAHPTDARLDRYLGNLEAKSTPQTRCCAPQTITEPFLLCSRVHYPAERGHSHQGISFP